jgi:Zn-dependent oligopeptidase
MFTKFESEGLLNPATGMSYRKWILQPGGSVEPDKLIEGFLGRKSTPQAFLKSIGLE